MIAEDGRVEADIIHNFSNSFRRISQSLSTSQFATEIVSGMREVALSLWCIGWFLSPAKNSSR